MKTKKGKAAKKAKKTARRAQGQSTATPATKQPKPSVKIAVGARSRASRRTAEGKFTKAIFNQIGGKESRRFAAMTWKERDAFMAKPENAVVRGRYEKHMASVGGK